VKKVPQAEAQSAATNMVPGESEDASITLDELDQMLDENIDPNGATV
jgi:hypothetical protein